MQTSSITNIFGRKINPGTASFFCLLVMAFGLPWSGVLFRIGFFGFLFFYFLSGKWVEKSGIVLKTGMVRLSALLFLVILASLTYTIAPYDLAILDVERYLKLLLIGPLIFTIDSKEKRLCVLNALAAGIAMLMLPTLLDGTGIANALGLPLQQFTNQVYHATDKNGVINLVYWRNQIVHGFLVSILFFICLCKVTEIRKNRILLLMMALLCVVDITLFIAGRMALLGLIAAVLFFAVLKLKTFTRRISGLAFLVSLCVMLYLSVDTVNHRINTIFSETQSYYKHNDKSTSAGHRLHYWEISLDLFNQSKIAGAGAGAFRHTLVSTNDPFAGENHSHAHNEYLTILSQYGMAGLSIFIAMLVYGYYMTSRLEDSFERYAYQGIMLIFSVNILTDSMLYNPHEGWTFVIVLSLIAAASRSQYLEKPQVRTPM